MKGNDVVFQNPTWVLFSFPTRTVHGQKNHMGMKLEMPVHICTHTHSQLKSSSNYLLGLYSLLEFQINIIWLFKLLITEWVSNNTKYLEKKWLQIFFYLMCLSHVPDPNVPLKLKSTDRWQPPKWGGNPSKIILIHPCCLS